MAPGGSSFLQLLEAVFLFISVTFFFSRIIGSM